MIPEWPPGRGGGDEEAQPASRDRKGTAALLDGGGFGGAGHLGQGADDDLLGHQRRRAPGLLPAPVPMGAAGAVRRARRRKPSLDRDVGEAASPAHRDGERSQTIMLATRITVPAFLTNSTVRRPTSFPIRATRAPQRRRLQLETRRSGARSRSG